MTENMKRYERMNSEPIESLPVDVQNEIRRMLKAYNEASVTYEYGRYHIGGVSIKKEYGADHRYVGTYFADDVYTEEERMINYMESFHEYPIQYKGKRDYRWLNSIGFDWNLKFKFDENGNYEIA